MNGLASHFQGSPVSQGLSPSASHHQALYAGHNMSSEAADYWTGKIPGLSNGLGMGDNQGNLGNSMAQSEAHKLIGRPLAATDPMANNQGWSQPQHSWNHQA